MLSFDNILENKIGQGIYQVQTLIIVGLVELYESIYFVQTVILTTILSLEWQLDKKEIASLGSSYQFGYLFGNFFCAYIIDYFGRKYTIIFLSAFSTLLSIYSSLLTSFFEMIIVRFCFGWIEGITCPLSYILISEISIAKIRGRFSFTVSLIYNVGKIYSVLSYFIFLNDFTSGNWRGLFIFNAIPSLLCFLLSICILRESTRFILAQGKYCEAFQQIEQIASQNNSEEIFLTQQEKDGLIAWQIKQHQSLQINVQNGKQKDIFSKPYLKKTIYIWCFFILANLQHMTLYFIMPFLFAENNSSFLDMLYIYILEFIFSWFFYIYIDNPQYGGRLKILIYSSCILVFANLFLYYYKNQFLFFGMFLINIALKCFFSVLFLICCEDYPLQLRSKGSGLAQAIGKLISAPSAYLFYPLFTIDPYLPFLIQTGFAILMLILSLTYPNDRTQKPLEEIQSDESY